MFVFDRLQTAAADGNVVDEGWIDRYRLGLTCVRAISIWIRKCGVAKGALLTGLGLANDGKIVGVKTLAKCVLGVSKREEEQSSR